MRCLPMKLDMTTDLAVELLDQLAGLVSVKVSISAPSWLFTICTRQYSHHCTRTSWIQQMRHSAHLKLEGGAVDSKARVAVVHGHGNIHVLRH